MRGPQKNNLRSFPMMSGVADTCLDNGEVVAWPHSKQNISEDPNPPGAARSRDCRPPPISLRARKRKNVGLGLSELLPAKHARADQFNDCPAAWAAYQSRVASRLGLRVREQPLRLMPVRKPICSQKPTSTQKSTASDRSPGFGNRLIVLTVAAHQR